MLMTHSILIKAFLGFLVLGLFIPFMTKNNSLKFKKFSFMFTMIFQGLATMIAFAGLIAVVSEDLGFATTTIIMIAIFALMMFLEIKKYKGIKKANLSDALVFKSSRASFLKVNVLQIFILVAMVIMMILRAKGILSI